MAYRHNPSGDRDPFRIDLSQESIGDIQQKNQKKNQPFLVDLVTLERLFFQTIPLQIEYDPKTNLAILPSLGSNLPGYQFTGAEDTLSMEVSWYCDDESRQDVLKKIKWLESLSKANGYIDGLHHLQFVMGDMFKDSKWVMSKAGPIIMKNFNREFGMMPMLASTPIELKKVATINPTHSIIRKIST